MRTPEQNEALLANMRTLLRLAAQNEVVGFCAVADVFGRGAANALARYLECERKREALARFPTVSINRELSSIPQ